jgi:hypothetical protein
MQMDNLDSTQPYGGCDVAQTSLLDDLLAKF